LIRFELIFFDALNRKQFNMRLTTQKLSCSELIFLKSVCKFISRPICFV
jgi:hypothetical protein